MFDDTAQASLTSATEGAADAEARALELGLDGAPEHAALRLAPGSADLAVRAAALAPEDVNDYDLVELVAAFERVAAWARTRAAIAAAALSRRPTMEPEWPIIDRVQHPNIAADELSARLAISRRAARTMIDVGAAIDGPLAATGALAEEGRLDWGKVQILAEALSDQPLWVSLGVEDRVLPRAPRRTHTQLRSDVRRALLEVDPVHAEDRRERAYSTRRVCRPRAMKDGMAALYAVLPAEHAVAVDAVLTAAARGAISAGDERTTDQLRADALVAMAAHAWTSGGIGAFRDDSPNVGGAMAGKGGDAAPRTATSGDAARTSGDGAGPEAAPASPVVPEPPTFRLAGAGGLNAQIHVLVPYTTLIDAEDEPAELVGFGPISADVARRLAVHGTWRRLLTDPATGEVTEVGRTRYRPPPDMAALVRARDGTCLVPTCSVTADDCDLDHHEPFRGATRGGVEPTRRGGGRGRAGEAGRARDESPGGRTDPSNLGPLCRRDHLLKTHAGWRLTRDPGALRSGWWVTPTGHRYLLDDGDPPF